MPAVGWGTDWGVFWAGGEAGIVDGGPCAVAGCVGVAGWVGVAALLEAGRDVGGPVRPAWEFAEGGDWGCGSEAGVEGCLFSAVAGRSGAPVVLGREASAVLGWEDGGDAAVVGAGRGGDSDFVSSGAPARVLVGLAAGGLLAGTEVIGDSFLFAGRLAVSTGS